MTETCFGVGEVDQAREERTTTVERIVATFKKVTRCVMADLIVPEEKKVVAVFVIFSELKKTAVPKILMTASGVRTWRRMV